VLATENQTKKRSLTLDDVENSLDEYQRQVHPSNAADV
jgi:hypothetical protein